MPFRLEAVRDSTFCEIIRADLYFDIISWHDTDSELPQLPGKMSNDFLLVFERNSEMATRERFVYPTAHFDELFFDHNLRCNNSRTSQIWQEKGEIKRCNSTRNPYLLSTFKLRLIGRRRSAPIAPTTEVARINEEKP